VTKDVSFQQSCDEEKKVEKRPRKRLSKRRRSADKELSRQKQGEKPGGRGGKKKKKKRGVSKPAPCRKESVEKGGKLGLEGDCSVNAKRSVRTS